jgi:hypothetical protein
VGQSLTFCVKILDGKKIGNDRCYLLLSYFIFMDKSEKRCMIIAFEDNDPHTSDVRHVHALCILNYFSRKGHMSLL